MADGRRQVVHKSNRSHVQPSEPLTIIGASARAAAYSARRAGFAPIAGDLFADVDLQSLCPTTRVENYPLDLEAVISGPQDGGWMYTGAIENHPDLVAGWAARRPLLGNDADTLRRMRDPLQMATSLRAAGICCPNVSLSATEMPRDGSWLCKPVLSAGGAHIVRWDAQAVAQRFVGAVYFQEHITGTAFSAVYVGAAGRSALVGVTRQLLGGEGPFRYVGSMGPIAIDRAQRAQFERIGSTLAREFGLTGLFGVDVVVNERGVWPVEVNPRYTASVEVLENALGINAVAMHVRACRNRWLPVELPHVSGKMFGKRILFAEDDLVADIDPQTPLIADVPAMGTVVSKGWPIATVFATAETEASLVDALRSREEDVLRQTRGASPRG